MKFFYPKTLWRKVSRCFFALIIFVLGIATIPHHWCSRQSNLWFDGDKRLQQGLAASVERWIKSDLTRENFTTGSSQFNGEWLFGTYVMAGLGYGQVAIEQPENRAHYLELMRQCIDSLLTPPVRAFDREMWSNDPIDTLTASNCDHAAD